MTEIRIDRLRKLFGPRDLDVKELCLEDVELSHLTRCGLRKVLSGADLVVGRGEVVVVQGQTQAGKSTLAHVLDGSLEPDGGVVAVDGHLRSHGLVATISHPPASDWSDSVDAHGYLAAAFAKQGFPSKAAGAVAGEALDALGLADLADQGPWDVDHLDRVRLAVAGALTSMPSWLVLDEPELKLGSAQSEMLCGFVHVVCVEAHLGCVWLTRSSGIASLADRWLVLRDGQLTAMGEMPSRRSRLC